MAPADPTPPPHPSGFEIPLAVLRLAWERKLSALDAVADLERRRERDRALMAEPDGLGPMSLGHPAKPKVVRGKNRNAFGRVGPHPDAPKRLDLPKAERDKLRAPLISVPADLRTKLERRSAHALLLDVEPDWAAGNVVPVMRRTDGEGNRDGVLLLEILSLEWFEAKTLDAHRAQMLGYANLAELAAARYPKVTGNSAFRVKHLMADESAVWFAVVMRSMHLESAPFELDPDPQVPGSGAITPRWLGRAGEGDYTESEHRARNGGLLDAGVCVEPKYQAKFTKDAQPSIEAGAVLGLEKSAEAKAAGAAIRRARIRADRPHVAQRRQPRRKPRKATIHELRRPASDEEISTVVGGGFVFDPHAVEPLNGLAA